MVTDFLKKRDVKSGVVNGIIVILFTSSIFGFFYLTLGIKEAVLPFIIATMFSGYNFKRKNKMFMGIVSVNSDPRNVFLHVLGMTIVFVPFFGFIGYFDDFFSSEDFGVLAKSLLFILPLIGVWFNTFSLMLLGSFFCRIKFEPSPVEENLTIIATFSDSIQAQIAKDVLEINEVPASLQNQFLTSIWPVNINLQVPRKFEKKAQEILQELDVVEELRS